MTDTILPKQVNIPHEVTQVTSKLENAGFEAYLVGGCVRDILMGLTPNDWDITTNATPEEITEIFEHSHYDNDYGTVRVVNDDTDDDSLKVIEVTTYRLEAEYSDSRRPDHVEFSDKLEDDLKRRDFTINAFALRVHEKHVSRDTSFSVSRENLTDLFEGLHDLQSQLIRTVGDPDERFNEDALRILRAIRFSVQLNFHIEGHTLKAIADHANQLENIAVERIRDEFVKIIMSDDPKTGIEVAHETGVLRYIIPELEEAIDIEQNQAHAYTVWEHLLRSLQGAADKGWPLEIRLAALLHDIAKPKTRRYDEEKGDFTFYGHEVVGSRVTRSILTQLKFPNELIETVTTFVRWHMFFSDPEKITLSAVRRLIRNVGGDNVWDLMNLRVADRIGTGRPKEEPYRLRKYYAMIEEALRDPVSVEQLKIDGNRIMDVTGETPGPRLGWMLHALLEEVLDDPSLNTAEYLEKRTKELSDLPDEELKKLGEQGKEARETAEQKEVREIRDKFHVK
ncbi:MAG: HD domain-containing protein [Candidatus Paceibacterota bacterium]